MSSPLDRIEARERVRANGQEMPWVLLTEDEMLALVNVARAAEEAARLSRPTEAQMHALREALAVLDKEPA